MNNDVPALNHTMEVAHWWPTVLIHCACQPGKPPTLLLLHAFGLPAQCPYCKKKATAVGILNTETGPAVNVEVTVPSTITLGH